MRKSATVSARRPGVILIVVLALLALLALVGITFVLQADSQRSGARGFQDEIEDLNSDTRGLAFFLAADLEQVDDGEGVDLGAYGSALGRLGERAASLQDEIGRVRREATDPAVRADLERLDRDLAIYLRYLCGLAELIDLIRGRD